MTATADALMAIFGFKRVEGEQMKTDRELLELAAKAAGISFFLDSYGRVMQMRAGLMPAPWNPLTDDGDALRLAVKLNIRTEQCWFPKWTTCYYNIDGDMGHSFRVFHESDPYAATRRALVRAAAEIGKDHARSQGF